MAFTLTQVRQIARGMYGLEYSSTEDQLYSDPFLNKLVNKAHHWFAGVTGCYWNDALSQALTTSQASYALSGLVIEPNVRSFRLKVSTTYTRLPVRAYESLLEQYGALEGIAAGTPLYVYLRPGTANAAVQKFELYPPPNAANGTANGTVYYAATVYPSELTSDSDTFPLDDPNLYRLIPAICWEMANFDASRGRPDAPVNLWAQKALAEAVELQRIIRMSTREWRRTALVGASPVADVEDRRVPSVLRLGQG